MNRAMLKLTGCEEHDLLGKKITRIPHLKNYGLTRFQEIVECINEKRTPPVFEIKWTHTENTCLWFEIRTSLNLKNNKVVGFNLSLHDIS